MTSKKKLKKRNKRLKKENKQMWRDYCELGKDYGDYVELYHDVIALLAKFDAELLLKVVKATIRDCNEVELATCIAASESGDTIRINCETKAWLNGEEREVTEVSSESDPQSRIRIVELEKQLQSLQQYSADIEESHADYDKAFKWVIRALVDTLGEEFIRATIDECHELEK